MANPYYDGDGILKNLLGITAEKYGVLEAEKKLEKIEYAVAREKTKDILTGNFQFKSSTFGIDRLKEVHKYLFDGIFEWAGQERNVTFTKGFNHPDIFGNAIGVFASPDDFADGWRGIEIKTTSFLKSENLDFAEKMRRLVDIYADINHMHIFPEGNGRTTQIFMQMLAKEQGIEIEFDKIAPEIKSNWDYASAISGIWGELEGKTLFPHPSDKKPLTQILQSISRELPVQKQEVTYEGIAQEAKGQLYLALGIAPPRQGGELDHASEQVQERTQQQAQPKGMKR